MKKSKGVLDDDFEDVEDPFGDVPLIVGAVKPTPARTPTPYEQRLADARALTDFLSGVGLAEIGATLEERGVGWSRTRDASEVQVQGWGLPRAQSAALAEALRKHPGTRLYKESRGEKVEKVAEKEKGGGEKSVGKRVVNLDARMVEIDYESMEELPPLPREPPPIGARIEYKNYMRLRYEHQKRENAALSPRPSPRAEHHHPEPLKSPKTRPLRAAPPPPSGVVPFSVRQSARVEASSPRESQRDEETKPLPVSPKPSPRGGEETKPLPVSPKPVRSGDDAKPPLSPKPSPRGEDAKPPLSPKPRPHLPTKPASLTASSGAVRPVHNKDHRLTEMFVSMGANLGLDGSVVIDEEEEEEKVVEKKRESSGRPLTMMLDEIDDEMADLDVELAKKKKDNVMRKSHLEQLSEVLAEADEFGNEVKDSFFESEIEDTTKTKKSMTLMDTTDEDYGSSVIPPAAPSEVELPVSKTKPLPPKKVVAVVDKFGESEDAFSEDAPKEQVDSWGEKKKPDNVEEDDDEEYGSYLVPGALSESETATTEFGSYIALGGGGEDEEEEEEEDALPQPSDSVIEDGSELPSLPPIVSDGEDE